MSLTRSIYEKSKNSLSEMLSDLIWYANFDSSSFEPESLISCEQAVRELFRKRLGIEASRTYPGPYEGTHHLVFEFGQGLEKVFVVGHYDTVWKKGTLACHVEGDTLYGPGVFDMKGGTIIMIWMLKILSEMNLLGNKKFCIFLNCDEETGSHSSSDYIMEEAKDSQFCLVFEPGTANGSVKTGRKGCSEYIINIKGVSSHAGLDIQKGRNAIEEMAYQIVRIQKLTNLEIGTTFNVGVCSGGNRGCMVPDFASFVVNCRYLTKEQAQYCYDALHNLETVIEGTSIEVVGGVGSMPMIETPESSLMYKKIKEAGEELGLGIGKVVVGGTSDGNRVSGMGIPTIDGLGACGDGAHALNEHMFIESLATRVAIVGSMLAQE